MLGSQYSFDQMVNRNITMLSSIGAMAYGSVRIMNSTTPLELNEMALLCVVPVSMHPLPWHWHYDA